MNTTLNDATFEAGREHYRDMLRAAQANIELRRGERPDNLHLSRIATLFGRALDLARGTQATASSTMRTASGPCPDGAACE